jgi:hypothetical protein
MAPATGSTSLRHSHRVAPIRSATGSPIGARPGPAQTLIRYRPRKLGSQRAFRERPTIAATITPAFASKWQPVAVAANEIGTVTAGPAGRTAVNGARLAAVADDHKLAGVIETTEFADIPEREGIYAFYDRDPRSAACAYVGETTNLRRRLRQHLVLRNSSVATETSVVGLMWRTTRSARSPSVRPQAVPTRGSPPHPQKLPVIRPEVRSDGARDEPSRATCAWPEDCDRRCAQPCEGPRPLGTIRAADARDCLLPSAGATARPGRRGGPGDGRVSNRVLHGTGARSDAAEVLRKPAGKRFALPVARPTVVMPTSWWLRACAGAKACPNRCPTTTGVRDPDRPCRASVLCTRAVRRAAGRNVAARGAKTKHAKLPRAAARNS